MERMMRKVLQTYCLGICIALPILTPTQNVYATTYTLKPPAPGTIYCGGSSACTSNPLGSTQTVPPLLLNSGDTVTINDGTSAYTTNAYAFTLGISNGTTPTSTISTATTTVTVGQSTPSTAILSYEGSSTGGVPFSVVRNDTTSNITNVINNGTISAGTGINALYFSNSSSSSPNDTYNITLNSGSSLSGAIITSGVHAINLTLNGSANAEGTINLNVFNNALTTSNSIFTIQNAANYTPTGSLANIGLLHVTGSSTLTIDQISSNINALTVDSGSTVNINSALNGVASSDGALTNNGTLNITANIAKTGTFTGTGIVNVSEVVSFATNNYSMTTHNVIMNDISDYGQVTMSGTGKNFTATNFNIDYTAGYFPAGSYTLVNAGSGTITVSNQMYAPSNTLFLTFSKPIVTTQSGSNIIQLSMTRTPFNQLATTSLTQVIGGTLESMGGTNPISGMLPVLNGVEGATTQSALEYSLQQLAPLLSAPVFCFEVQAQSLTQVELRLAELRSGIKHYYAGDIAQDNHVWIRPFGSKANQLAKDDSFGYTASSGGFGVGFDRNLDTTYTVGAAFAYALSHVNDKVNTQSNTQIKSYLGLGYGSYNYDDVTYFDWIIAVTLNNFNAQRVINLNNVYIANAQSTYNSQQYTMQGLWGKCFSFFDWLQATPEGSVQYMYGKQYPYTETGASGANLNIERPNSNIVQLTLGSKLSVPLYANPAIIVPEIHGTMYYYPITGEQSTVFNFVDGGGPMSSFFNMSRTGLQLGCALTVAVVDKLEVKFEYDYMIQDRYHAQSIYLDLRYLL
jgi:uncharacterized protein with beta-barrel porin domain